MSAPRILALTGSGISAESGLGTFRDTGGIWAKFDPYDLATPEAFARDPFRVLDFYNHRRRNLLDAAPNLAHVALARLEMALRAVGGEFTLITQNVDDLHERGGSTTVWHMHGELLKTRCDTCGALFKQTGDLAPDLPCPRCETVGFLRPHVVWFGEVPFHFDVIDAAVRAADLFVSIGTSGSVYPAAGIVNQAKALGVATLELNLEPSDNATLFDDGRYGPATLVVPAWADGVMAGLNGPGGASPT